MSRSQSKDSIEQVSVVCSYFVDSNIEVIANEFIAQGADLHLWALEEVLPSVAQWTRGQGRFHKTTNLNFLSTFCNNSSLILFIDDDLTFPANFLSDYCAVLNKYSFDLAQPALTADSEHSFPQTLSRTNVVAREVNLIEQMAFSMSNRMLLESMPLPEDFWMGWGIELLWQKIIERNSWKAGIIDSVPIRHGSRKIFSNYDRSLAVRRMDDALERHGLKYNHIRTIKSWYGAEYDAKPAKLAEKFLKILLKSDMIRTPEFWDDPGSANSIFTEFKQPSTVSGLPSTMQYYWRILHQARIRLGIDNNIIEGLSTSSDIIQFLIFVFSEAILFDT